MNKPVTEPFPQRVQDEIQHFESLLGPIGALYNSATVSYLAVKRDSSKVLVAARIVLFANAVDAGEVAKSFDSKNLSARRFVLSADTVFETAMRWIRAGHIEHEGLAIPLPRDNFGTSAYCDPLSFPVYRGQQAELRTPSLTLRQGERDTAFGIKRGLWVIDWELKTSTFPYENIEELVNDFDLQAENPNLQVCFIDVVATAPAHIDPSSRVDGKHAIIVFKSSKRLATSKLRLNYKVVDTALKVHARQTVQCDEPKCEWADGKEQDTGTVQFDIGEQQFVRAFLSYDDYGLHQVWISDPTRYFNPKSSILGLADPDLAIVRSYISGERLSKRGNMQGDFEDAVCWLLSASGFAPLHLGLNSRTRDFVDIVAFSRGGNVLVVECTTGRLDEDQKLSKLTDRTTKIHLNLKEIGYGAVLVQPVIVTMRPKAAVQPELERAGEAGIAVVCQEQLQQLLGEIRLPEQSDQLFASVCDMVPKTKNGSGAGGISDLMHGGGGV